MDLNWYIYSPIDHILRSFSQVFLKFDRTHITTIVTTIEKAEVESDDNVTFTVLLHARTETLGHLATVDS